MDQVRNDLSIIGYTAFRDSDAAGHPPVGGWVQASPKIWGGAGPNEGGAQSVAPRHSPAGDGGDRPKNKRKRKGEFDLTSMH